MVGVRAVKDLIQQNFLSQQIKSAPSNPAAVKDLLQQNLLSQQMKSAPSNFTAVKGLLQQNFIKITSWELAMRNHGNGGPR